MMKPQHQSFDETWLYDNPDALRSVLKGLEEAKEGKFSYIGSFAKYADEDIEDD